MGRDFTSLIRIVVQAGWLFFVLVSLVGSLKGRVWTSTNGVKIEGEVFEVDEERVGLRMDGRDYFFLITRFIPADRLYLKEWKSHKRCGVCSGKLGNNFKEAGEQKFHPPCFRCMVCQKTFVGGDGLGKDPWGGLVHLKHLKQAQTCGSCSRFFSQREADSRQFFQDGRVSCKVCLRDAVFDLEKLNQVRERVLPSLSRVGLVLPSNRPTKVYLVDRRFLDREAKRIKASGNLRGLTLTKYKITRGAHFSDASFEHRIYILKGLPYVECIAVLAHEYAHVWLNERFIESTPLEIEGFCNLISELCLAEDKSKISTLLRENMMKSENPVYGLGFRKMRAKLQSLGWRALLAEMKGKSKPPR